VRVATWVLADAQDSQNGGVKACLRRSCATGWDGDWRGGTAVSDGFGELNYITGPLVPCSSGSCIGMRKA